MNGLKRKLCDPDFLEFLNNYDIIFLCETWLAKTDDLNLDINGFESEHLFGNKSKNTKKGRFSGGISIYFKSCLSTHVKIVEKEQSGLIWLKINGNIFKFNDDVYICNVYISPNNSKVINTDDFDFLSNKLN